MEPAIGGTLLVIPPQIAMMFDMVDTATRDPPYLLARMLGGLEISKETPANAKQMLKQAQLN